MKSILKIKLLAGGAVSSLLFLIWKGHDTKKVTERKETILDCSCNGTLYPQFQYTLKDNKSAKSTCSNKNTLYKSNQNVVAYSLYLPSSSSIANMYIKGMVLNLKQIRKYLKGFVMRVYTDVPLNDTYCNIICSNPDLLWCDIKNTPSHGDLSDMFFMTWRFIPLGDPTVEIFLVRDLDSVISEREAAAVKDWLKTNKTFHVMRDRKDSHSVPILGGLWGGRNSLFANAITYQSKLIQQSRLASKDKGSDQVVLDKFLFSPLINLFVAYDSYTCERWERHLLVRPFPMPRRDANDFTGNPVLLGESWEFQECPLKCRPAYGQNWTWLTSIYKASWLSVGYNGRNGSIGQNGRNERNFLIG